MKYGFIYKISYEGLDYYGSSNNKDRFIKHKNNYKRYKNGKYNYTTVFDLFENAKKNNELPIFEIIACFREQLCRQCQRKIEQRFIDNNKCINKNNAYTDKKEYRKRKSYEKKNLLNQQG